MDNISIHPPLGGEWQCLRPPGHHPYAFDYVQLDTSRKSTHRSSWLRNIVGGIPAANFYCWGKPVFSPVDGTVFQLGNDWQDNKTVNIWKTSQLWYRATYQFRPQLENGRLDIRPNAGNYVMIETDQGNIIFLAHLKNQSIQVSEGSAIKKGEMIGEVGNSGNSTMPHLHINIFDQMHDPLNAKILPFKFEHYDLLKNGNNWVEQRFSIPTPKSIVRFNK